MPISPYYKPINQIRSEVDSENAQNFGLGLNPVGMPTTPETPAYDLGIDPLEAPQAHQGALDDVTSHQTPPPPAMDDNQILQKYMRQKYPDAFTKGQEQVAANQVSRQDLDNLQNSSDLDAITSAFSKAAGSLGAVNGVGSKSGYADIAKASQAADQQSIQERMNLAKQGEDMQQNAIKGLDALDNQSYQASLRPLEQRAKEQSVAQGAANLEKTQMGLQQAQLDFRNKQNLSDPDSVESKTLRGLAKRFGVPVDESMSGDRLQDLIPIAEKAYNADENRKSRIDLAQQRAQTTKMAMEDRQSARADKDKAKEDAKLLDRVTAAGKAVDDYQGSRGPMADQVKRLNSANAIDVMIRDKNGVLENLTQTQLQELVIGVNKMLGGSEAHGAIEALVPKNINMNATAIKDWITSEPHGVNQQKFVDLMAHTLDREKLQAENTIKAAQIKKLKSQYSDLEKTAPDRFNQFLSTYGITPEQYKNGIKDTTAETRRMLSEREQTAGKGTSKGRTLYVPGQGGGH